MEKKQIIITVVIAIVMFATGFLVGDASAIGRVNKAIDKGLSNSQSTTNPNESASSGQSKSVTYKFGEEGKSGNWNIKVMEAKEATAIQGGSSSDNKTTTQKFIVIKLQMNNISKSPQQYSPDEFALGNMNDKTQYNMDMDAAMTANQKETIYNNNKQFVGVYDDVNPGTPKQTYVVFEVPKTFNISDGVLINANAGADAAGYYLK